jgi:hypothetical protein
VKTPLLSACIAAFLISTLSAQTTARLPWGDPDLEGIWTNATLTTLQRAPELGTKAFFTADEAVAWEKQRIQATNADRPLRAGEVGAYNDAFFERGKSGVKSRRTSLIIDPPDGRIPAFTPEAQQKVDARTKHEAVSPGGSSEDRWLTERCILFGATGADAARAVQQQLPDPAEPGLRDDPRRDEPRRARDPAR